MTKEIEELVCRYVADVNAQWKTGEATEHSYRPALKALLEGLLPKVTAINEPSRIACGARFIFAILLVRSFRWDFGIMVSLGESTGSVGESWEK